MATANAIETERDEAGARSGRLEEGYRPFAGVLVTGRIGKLNADFALAPRWISVPPMHLLVRLDLALSIGTPIQ